MITHVLEKLQEQMRFHAKFVWEDKDIHPKDPKKFADEFVTEVFFRTWKNHHKGCWDEIEDCLFCQFEDKYNIDLTKFQLE